MEEDHFALIRETFERTTEAMSDWGLVWHTADCCWWGSWRMEMEIWACVHVKGQYFEHYCNIGCSNSSADIFVLNG